MTTIYVTLDKKEYRVEYDFIAGDPLTGAREEFDILEISRDGVVFYTPTISRDNLHKRVRAHMVDLLRERSGNYWHHSTAPARIK